MTVAHKSAGGLTRKFMVFALFAAMLMISASFMGATMASGPTLEDPTHVVINEIFSGSDSWVELVNPTANGIFLFGWRIQTWEGGIWKTIKVFGIEVIGGWGSKFEYNVARVALPGTGSMELRLIDAQGNEVDRVTAIFSGAGTSWARFVSQTGQPVDTNSWSDWYTSMHVTEGSQNDQMLPLPIPVFG